LPLFISPKRSALHLVKLKKKTLFINLVKIQL